MKTRQEWIATWIDGALEWAIQQGTKQNIINCLKLHYMHKDCDWLKQNNKEQSK